MDFNTGLPVLEGARPVLGGARLTLRPLRRADSATLLEILTLPGVARWWGAYDAAKLERDFFDPAWAYTYLVHADETPVGIVQFHEVPDPDYKSAGIDITIADGYQDRGVGTEVLRTIIVYLIDGRGHHRMTIDPAIENPRAIHTYEKVGFRPVGVMRRYERDIDGRWHDGLLMDLLADEFERS